MFTLQHNDILKTIKLLKKIQTIHNKKIECRMKLLQCFVTMQNYRKEKATAKNDLE